jgi:membrane-associated phospholipid phosphatase
MRLATLAAIFSSLVLIGLALHAGARLAAGPDRRLLGEAVTSRSGTLTLVAHVASVCGRSWFLILMSSAVALALLSRQPARGFGPLVAVLGAEALQHIVKAMVQRARPPVLHLEHVTGSSFPSGHATESAAVAAALVCLARGMRRRNRIAILVLAALATAAIGASRVYLGVHYPTDALAGVALGVAWGTSASWWTSGIESCDRRGNGK